MEAEAGTNSPFPGSLLHVAVSIRAFEDDDHDCDDDDYSAM